MEGRARERCTGEGGWGGNDCDPKSIHWCDTQTTTIDGCVRRQLKASVRLHHRRIAPHRRRRYTQIAVLIGFSTKLSHTKSPERKSEQKRSRRHYQSHIKRNNCFPVDSAFAQHHCGFRWNSLKKEKNRSRGGQKVFISPERLRTLKGFRFYCYESREGRQRQKALSGRRKFFLQSSRDHLEDWITNWVPLLRLCVLPLWTDEQVMMMAVKWEWLPPLRRLDFTCEGSESLQ